ncbi:MAG: T9SS type A sorting domain-containing protein, partial [Bacteroidales bacterium]|nr:T9SS type A sorting domain-containing protein [Bacteroidales bacterium]
TTYNLTGLTDDHTYSVFVRAKCEEGVYGKWSTKVDFTTPEETGINTADGTNLSIFPNPTSNVTTISVNGVNGDVSITIVDMNGRTVLRDSMECEGGCTKSIEVSGLAQGAYFVRVSGDSLNMVKKLIVK